MPSVVCYGEVLLRLTAPSHGPLLQSPSLGVNVGGAEANVAVSLTRFGHPASLVTVLPDNALGHAALGEVRRHGVQTERVRHALTRGRPAPDEMHPRRNRDAQAIDAP